MRNDGSAVVLLVGMKHCGKSTVGRIIQKKRGWEFVDLDDLLQDEFLAGSETSTSETSTSDISASDISVSRHSGRDTGDPRTESPPTVREIYKRLGAAGFAELEAAAAARLVERIQKASQQTPPFGKTTISTHNPQTRDHRTVVALGGGTVENGPAMEHLSRIGLFVYLEEEPEILFRRIKRRGLPPFLDPAHPYSSFLALFRRRTELFQRVADVTVALEGRGPEEAAQLALNALEEYFRGRK